LGYFDWNMLLVQLMASLTLVSMAGTAVDALAAVSFTLNARPVNAVFTNTSYYC
jgi:hypothetical protein